MQSCATKKNTRIRKRTYYKSEIWKNTSGSIWHIQVREKLVITCLSSLVLSSLVLSSLVLSSPVFSSLVNFILVIKHPNTRQGLGIQAPVSPMGIIVNIVLLILLP